MTDSLPCYRVSIMAISSTSFPRKFAEKTTVIRVPKSLSAELLKLAELLDKTPDLKDDLQVFLSRPKEIAYSKSKEVNVSSIPQRSPFRYPGGKTWLIPCVRDWLKSKDSRPARLIEPFAGGAIVSLTTAFEGLAKHVIFAEMDQRVAAVWRVVTNGQSEWLAQRILEFEVNEENVRKELSKNPQQLRDLAFQAILRNRVQRGGIMAPGAGLIKTGENGRGLLARWYPETLARRIREINDRKDRLTFIEGDAFDLIKEHQNDAESVFYVDPPYTVASKRLYTNWDIDHEALFKLLSECKGDFLMSYDNTDEVLELIKRHGFESKPVAMKSTHHARMTELLIGRDLQWLR